MTLPHGGIWRIAAILAIPLLISGSTRSVRFTALAKPAPEAIERELNREADQLQETFTDLLDQAAAVAERAHTASPGSAARAASGLLGTRVEGAARVRGDVTLEDWSGTPGEPAAVAAPGARPGFSLRRAGSWTRLDVTSPVAPDGSYGLATFLLDAPKSNLRFEAILPRVVERHALAHFEFINSSGAAEDLWQAFEGDNRRFQRGSPSRLFVLLAAPSGDVLVGATLQAIDPLQRTRLREQRADAIAATVFLLLSALLLPWRRLCGSAAGLGAALAAIAAARAALAWTRAPAVLLPREVGAAALYGSSDALGLFASPADLLLTALAFLLCASTAARALETFPSHRRAASAIVSGVALASLWFAYFVAESVARDSSVALLPLGTRSGSPGLTVLVAGLAVAIVATADWLATAWRAVFAKPGASRSGWVTAIAVVPVTLIASWTLVTTEERIVFDRLRSELAPQVLDQESRRRVALASAVRAAAESDLSAELVEAPGSAADSHGAYVLWAAGDLFHSGYRSSIELYDAAGNVRSRFGFGIPRLEEPLPRADAAAAAEPVARIETIRQGALTIRALHAESPIVRGGREIGVAVGHVLDEPDNLPFLPESSVYLAALGPGAPGGGWEDPWDAPAYVLYAANDTVLVSTVVPPPPPRPELRAAAKSGELVRAAAGDEPYAGFAVADAGGRLHFLAVPARGLLDTLGSFARLCMLALLVLVAIEAARLGPARLRPAALARAIRESFRRKLLAAVLAASILPVAGLALWVRTYAERRTEATLTETAGRVVSVVKRVVEDYAQLTAGDGPGAPDAPLNDEVLQWLRRLVGQEIHIYEANHLLASSTRELFSSGLLSTLLPGEVVQEMSARGRTTVVLPSRLGDEQVPVAYARVELPGATGREAVAAVPLVLEQREARRAVDRVAEVLLLVVALITAAVTLAAAFVARAVARPMGELVEATRRITSGDYATRLTPTTSDEVAALVAGFNRMAESLEVQRADLVRRREYIEALLRNATLGVLSTDAHGRVVTSNPAAAALLAGAAGAPRPGEPLADAVARDPALKPLAALLDGPVRAEGDPEDIDVIRGGILQRLRVVRVGLPDPEGGASGTLILLDDVTDLMRSNQLAAWTEMARAVAHEIKNPLTPIQLSSEHLRRLLADRGVTPAPEIDACLDAIGKQVVALRRIAAEFSTYAKLPDLERVPTDAAELMREVLAAYVPAPPLGVRIEERYAKAALVMVDRRVLARAVINLVENALEALRPEGGVLTAQVAQNEDGDEVILSIADTGPGIGDQARRHLFEPYFSTKTSGTGLGLGIVRRAAEAHGGRVELHSAAGEGTTFRIHLPALSAAQPPN